MGYDPATCAAKLTAAGLTPACEAMSNPFHCDDLQQISPVVHASCAELKAYYAPVQALVCMYFEDGTPTRWKYWPPQELVVKCLEQVPQKREGQTGWTIENCYCCCSCFAYDTMIAVPDGLVAIQELRQGAKVNTASVAPDGDIVWHESAVTYSSGVKGGVHPGMVYISHGDDDTDLVCNPDQVFLTGDRHLLRAGELTLHDELVDKDGNSVKINLIGIGEYTGGIHHISTDAAKGAAFDDHLILADGVIAGDFYMQLELGNAAHPEHGLKQSERPEIGSDAYNDEHGQHMKGEGTISFSASEQQYPKAQHKVTKAGKFKFYSERLLADVVENKGVSLFTRQQALSILEAGKQLPLSNPVPKSEVSNIFHILKGFYPEFNFYMDWYAMEPNVHVFEEYDQKFIVVTGGLARMVGLHYEGMMMAVAHGVARYIGLPPKTPEGWVGTGAADYFAFGVISRAIWYGNSWSKSAMPAFEQLSSIFKLISPKHAGGVPNNPVEYPSVECRLGAMQSGLVGGNLPECAGGPPVPKIGLQSVDQTKHGVALNMTYAPQEDEAVNIDNYVIEPEVEIHEAIIDKSKNFIVHLVAEFEPGQEYQVTIRNLQNYYGGGVDPNEASAVFRAR